MESKELRAMALVDTLADTIAELQAKTLSFREKNWSTCWETHSQR